MPGPHPGETYIITAVIEDEDGGWLRLVGFGDDWFDIVRFRPAVKRASDNEIEATLYHLRGLTVRDPHQSPETV